MIIICLLRSGGYYKLTDNGTNVCVRAISIDETIFETLT